MLHSSFRAAVLLISALPIAAFAQDTVITPERVDSSEPVQRALEENKGHANTVIEGKGKAIRISYRASEPLVLFLVPLKTDNAFVPTDYVKFTLPETTAGEILVDLTVSPGWSPAEHRYYVEILSKNETVDAAFTGMEFVPGSFFSGVQAAFTHLFTREPYTPSSYHAIRGYRIFGVSLTVLMGTILLIAVGTALALSTGETKLQNTLLVLFILCGLYNLRFGIDLLRFTGQHLSEYGNGTYDEAGSVYEVARAIKKLEQGSEGNPTVFVCRDGTNFKEKILRYFAYPTQITSDEADAKSATVVAVMDEMNWSEEGGVLKCGPINAAAQKLSEFSDGTILFRIQPS